MPGDGRLRRVIETESSSSNLVVFADEGGLSITLEPMVHPVTKIDVYDEEVGAFIEAVEELAEEAGLRDGGT